MIVGNCNRSHLRENESKTVCGLDVRFYETTAWAECVDCKNCLRILSARIKKKGNKR